MDRRRALLAASMQSGDVGWSFTLPLVDVSENLERYELNNEEDSRIVSLFNILLDNYYFEESFAGSGTWFVNEEWLQENPIYINGSQVIGLFCDKEFGNWNESPDFFIGYTNIFEEVCINGYMISAMKRI